MNINPGHAEAFVSLAGDLLLAFSFVAVLIIAAWVIRQIRE